MKTDLIYGVEDRPPFKDALFAALQHLLAIFVAIITPPLIIASALKLDVEKTGFLAGIFNSFPNSIFAQNNGIIQLTGVASRYVGYYIAGMLVLLGLFPIVGVIFLVAYSTLK